MHVCVNSAGFNCTNYGPPVSDTQQSANCTPQAFHNTFTSGGTLTSPHLPPQPSPFQQPNNTFDRDTLRTIKAALGHPAFLASWDGPYSMPCGSPGWDWLSCSPEGYVAEIRWPDMGLSGSLPSQFGLLRSLKALDLSRNRLAGTIPGAFGTEGGLSGLRELDLSRNMLTGPLPAGFRGLGELQRLDLSYNTFTVSIILGIAAIRSEIKRQTMNTYSAQQSQVALHLCKHGQCTSIALQLADLHQMPSPSRTARAFPAGRLSRALGHMHSWRAVFEPSPLATMHLVRLVRAIASLARPAKPSATAATAQRIQWQSASQLCLAAES
jgi:hypothetical protein